ncbi:MAG: VWA domain-containing protein [Alistipes sp.]
MYTQSITRAHRTAFLIALDQSGSMAETLTFLGRPMTKADAVAEVTDALLFELIERAHRSDGVRNYYDIALLGYSGDGIQPLLGETDFVTVNQLALLPPKMRTLLVERRLPDGSPALHRIAMPSRVTPRASGQTPMFEALLHVRDLAATWCAKPENADSFPPVIFNATDGEASDCDEEELREVASEIQNLHTNDGNVLLMNIHITTGETTRSLLFPTREEIASAGRYAQLLYDCSSEMPRCFDQTIRELRGGNALPPFRGLCYNASITELASIFNIGSISIPIH